MIPLRDINPRSTRPLVTVLLILINVGVFLHQISLGPRAGQELYTFGMIPARIPLLLTSSTMTLSQALFPLLTSMFLHGGWLHGGWLHLIGNMWFLWVFGDNVEDRLGHFKYLLFYLACGAGAGLAHTLTNLGSTVPAVGASGAISGVMGAYIVLLPRSRVLTLVPLLFFFFTIQLPAVVLLGYWFLIQLLSGLGSWGAHDAGGVAWWAHIGGFVLGAVLVMDARR
jgi:membrane associated rhomboid family serine protease